MEKQKYVTVEINFDELLTSLIRSTLFQSIVRYNEDHRIERRALVEMCHKTNFEKMKQDMLNDPDFKKLFKKIVTRGKENE